MADNRMFADDIEKLIEDDAAPVKRKRVQNRPKVVAAWSDENISKLISEVEVCPCIWNAGDKDYKNRNKRDAAWEKMSVETFQKQYGVDQLSAKWQALRCQYRSAFANLKKVKSGQAVSNKPQWKFYSQMDFVGAAENEQSAHTDSNLSLSDDGQSSASGPIAGCSGFAQRKRSAVAQKASAEDVAQKEMIQAGMKLAIDRLQQPKKAPDDIQIFGNYLVSNLRKIKDVKYRENTQRKLLQLLWDCIDQEPVASYSEYDVIVVPSPNETE